MRTWCLRGAYVSQKPALTGNDGRVRWHIFPYRRNRATTASFPWHATHWVDMARVKYFFGLRTWCLRGAYVSRKPALIPALTGKDGRVLWHIFPYRRDRATTTASCPWHATHWVDMARVKYFFGLRTWCLRVQKIGFDGQRRACSVAYLPLQEG